MSDCMKTWMKPAIAILALVATSQLASAQVGDAMAKPTGKETTYTGCIEAGASGTFTLTHVTADAGMHKDTMGKDAMKKDSMGKGTMGKDAIGKDAMAPTTLAIAGKGVDLSQHVGHKVSVTGRDEAMGKGMEKPDAMGKNVPPFAVSSIKVVAPSCGM